MLAIAGLLFVFAEPLVDDFCRAAVTEGTVAYVERSYTEWSGRWVANGAEALLLSRMDPIAFYPLLVGSIAMFHLFSLYVFTRAFFNGSLPNRLVAAIAGSFFVLFWCLHPSLGQGFYWFTGSIEYQLNIALSLIVFALLLEASRRRARSGTRVASTVVASLLAVLVTGLHELWGLIVKGGAKLGHWGGVKVHRLRERTRF